jgi:methionine-rich copper-binding protein CopC
MRKAMLAACVLMILPAWPAQAHAHLLESTPAEGSKLASTPRQLQLVFSEAVRVTALSIQGAGEAAPRKLSPLPGQVATRVAIDLAPLASGSYRVQWRALSADHHVAAGTLSFSVQGR